MTSRALLRLGLRLGLGLGLAAASLAGVACSSEASGAPEAETSDDAGAGKEGRASSSSSSSSGGGGGGGGGEEDAGPKKDAGADAKDLTAILGTLSGACGTVTALLAGTAPALEENVVTFVAGETYERAALSPGGQTIFDTPNAGGSSTESEVMSFEVLHHCEGASLVKTETQIDYVDAGGGPQSITDILVSIAGRKIGVSVTRAYKPSSQTLTDADVKTILEKKLQGINTSSARVVPADKWDKQILHVFTATKSATDAVARVYPTISPALRADTVVLVTQTTGGGFVYCNPDPPLGSECP